MHVERGRIGGADPRRFCDSFEVITNDVIEHLETQAPVLMYGQSGLCNLQKQPNYPPG